MTADLKIKLVLTCKQNRCCWANTTKLGTFQHQFLRILHVSTRHKLHTPSCECRSRGRHNILDIVGKNCPFSFASNIDHIVEVVWNFHHHHQLEYQNELRWPHCRSGIEGIDRIANCLRLELKNLFIMIVNI